MSASPPRGPSAPRVVLFDLDGTLVDTAPDLIGAANAMRVARGLVPLPYAVMRPMVSAGARGMVGMAFGVGPESADFPALRDEFLDRYAQGLLEGTRIFDAMRIVLDRLEAAAMPWGVVTNKAERFTLPLLQGLALASRAAVVICGDTTPHLKPDPAPLLEAARRLGVATADCVYVGDDVRDVQASRNAGMAVLAAAWGYLGQDSDIAAWGADHVLSEPMDLLKWLNLP